MAEPTCAGNCAPVELFWRRSLLHQLAFGDVDLGGHAGDELFAGIVDEQLELDGLDVALAAADVALGGEVGLGGFVDDLALRRFRRWA